MQKGMLEAALGWWAWWQQRSLAASASAPRWGSTLTVLYMGTHTIYIHTAYMVDFLQYSIMLEPNVAVTLGPADAFHQQLLLMQMGLHSGAKTCHARSVSVMLKHQFKPTHITPTKVQIRFKPAQPVLQALCEQSPWKALGISTLRTLQLNLFGVFCD